MLDIDASIFHINTAHVAKHTIANDRIGRYKSSHSPKERKTFQQLSNSPFSSSYR